MTTIFYNISTYSRFNLSESESDIHVFVKEYRERIKKQYGGEEDSQRTRFISFASPGQVDNEETWQRDNQERFFNNTINETLVKETYLSQLGFICSMVYSPDGGHVIVGHSTGIVQPKTQDLAYHSSPWIAENYNTFLKGTPNKILYNRWFFSELGAIMSMTYSPNGQHIIVGHATGFIQMRHGVTGIVLATLRNIQFPPKPIYALEYSKHEERTCYAACADGVVYRIEIPNIDTSQTPPELCIQADPALECLSTQYYGSPGTCTNATPYISQRVPALSVGINADQTKIVAGYGDMSLKVYDIETKEAEITYKVHKLRLQFIPKKLQRIHFGQVCALRCHDQRPFVFASGAWDKTLRIWDTRCKVGCMMTFEGVNICHDSIDLNRDHCISGSWQPMEALSVWDLTARKRIAIIRAQNRRPDVDGEYVYACRYWNSTNYNRKGKYGIIAGSGTNCVEVINLHNRYITCSYPAAGTVLAVASYQDRIAFGGTAPVFNIVSFHDPKHEPYEPEVEPDYDYTKASTLFARSQLMTNNSSDPKLESDMSRKSGLSATTSAFQASNINQESNINQISKTN